MNDPNGPGDEHGGNNPDRKSWAEKVTISDAAHAVGQAFKSVDKVIWVFERFYRNQPPGWGWLVRSFSAWLGIAAPWLGYILILEAALSKGQTIWPEDGFPRLTTGIIFFFVIVLPIFIAIVITQYREVSYAECFFGLGLRVGLYSLVILYVLKQLVGF